MLVLQSSPSTDAADPEIAALALMTVTEQRIEASWAPNADAEAEWIPLDSAGGVLRVEDAEEEFLVGYFPVPVGEIRQIRMPLVDVVLEGEDGSSVVLDGTPQLPSHTQSGWKWELVDGVPLQVGEDERVGARALFSWDDHLSHNRGIGFQLRPTVPLERFDVNPPETAPGVFVDQLTLHLEPGTTRADVDAMNAGLGRGASVVYAPVLSNVWRVRLPIDVDLRVGAEYYDQQPAVQAIWPAVNYAPQTVPADGMHQNYEIAGVARAWERGFVGSRDVRVAVIDATGFELESPDFYLNLSLNEGEIPPSVLGDDCEPCFVDADGNGRLDFVDLNDPVNWKGEGEPCDATVELVCDSNSNGIIDPVDLKAQGFWSASTDSWFNGIDNDDFDDDPSTFVDDLVGWRFDGGGLPETTTDQDVHGTQVMSLLGGLHASEPGNIGDGGIAGVAGKVSILPLRANAIAGTAARPATSELGMPDQRFVEAVSYVEALNATRTRGTMWMSSSCRWAGRLPLERGGVDR